MNNTEVPAFGWRALPREFYVRDARIVARELLGKTLVRRFEDGTFAAGRIVETEAYLADDPACHAFRGETKRNRTMFGPAGFAYIHQNYGIYWCLNAVTGETGVAEAALIRAVDPLYGHARLWQNFGDVPKGEKDFRLGAGPGRIGKSFAIDRALEETDLTNADSPLCFADAEPIPDDDVVTTTRIGITKGADLAYRFYVRSSLWISKREPRARTVGKTTDARTDE